MVNASQALRTISTFAGLDSDAVLNPHSTGMCEETINWLVLPTTVRLFGAGFFQEKKFSFDLNSKTSRVKIGIGFVSCCFFFSLARLRNCEASLHHCWKALAVKSVVSDEKNKCIALDTLCKQNGRVSNVWLNVV